MKMFFKSRFTRCLPGIALAFATIAASGLLAVCDIYANPDTLLLLMEVGAGWAVVELWFLVLEYLNREGSERK